MEVNMGAYNKLYLEDASDLQELLFEEVAKENKCDFGHFVDGYMNCKYRHLIDIGNPRVINMTWDELWMYLRMNCAEIFIPGERDIDTLQAGWIGRMYNILQFNANIPSVEIYKKIDYKHMQVLFSPLHTVSEEVALDKLLPLVR